MTLTLSLAFNSAHIAVKDSDVIHVHFSAQLEVSCENKNINNHFKKNKEVVMDKTNVSDNCNVKELENKRTKNCLARPFLKYR